MDQPTKGHMEQTESLTMPPMTTSTTTIVRPSVFGHLPWPATTTRQHLPITTPVTPSISGTKESEKNAKDEDDDEFDYEDEYYAHDQGVDEQIIRVVNADNDQGDDKDDVLRHDHDDQEQQDEEPRRSLVVVFHVGLFRACPVLKGELPSSVGKCLLLPLYFSFFVFRRDANAIWMQLSFFLYLFDERVLIASTRSRVESVKFTLSDAYHTTLNHVETYEANALFSFFQISPSFMSVIAFLTQFRSKTKGVREVRGGLTNTRFTYRHNNIQKNLTGKTGTHTARWIFSYRECKLDGSIVSCSFMIFFSPFLSLFLLSRFGYDAILFVFYFVQKLVGPLGGR